MLETGYIWCVRVTNNETVRISNPDCVILTLNQWKSLHTWLTKRFDREEWERTKLAQALAGVCTILKKDNLRSEKLTHRKCLY